MSNCSAKWRFACGTFTIGMNELEIVRRGCEAIDALL